METEHATESEAPATERVGNGWTAAQSPRHTSTLQGHSVKSRGDEGHSLILDPRWANE
ncbi:unnamed protein product, partial [marine sediment metagenome]